jgi:hypothetical protein
LSFARAVPIALLLALTAPAAAYTSTPADLGKSLRAGYTVVNALGGDSAYSAPTSLVRAARQPPAPRPPVFGRRCRSPRRRAHPHRRSGPRGRLSSLSWPSRSSSSAPAGGSSTPAARSGVRTSGPVAVSRDRDRSRQVGWQRYERPAHRGPAHAAGRAAQRAGLPAAAGPPQADDLRHVEDLAADLRQGRRDVQRHGQATAAPAPLTTAFARQAAPPAIRQAYHCLRPISLEGACHD